MDFRKTMELVAANCKRHKYYCANGYKCPLLKVPDDGGRYCLLGAPWPEDIDRICEAVEEIISTAKDD